MNIYLICNGTYRKSDFRIIWTKAACGWMSFSGLSLWKIVTSFRNKIVFTQKIEEKNKMEWKFQQTPKGFTCIIMPVLFIRIRFTIYSKVHFDCNWIHKYSFFFFSLCSSFTRLTDFFLLFIYHHHLRTLLAFLLRFVVITSV